MGQPHVLITRNIGQAAVQPLLEAGFRVEHNQADGSWDQPTLIDRAQQADGLICLLSDQINTAVLDACPRLKVVANVAVGYDNINVAAASERGVLVTNTPDVLTETTADLAFALLLAIARRLPEADAFMRAGRYTRFELFPEMLGVDVHGKTLGIVGMGRIGTAVARRAAAGFGMNVLYTGRSRHKSAEQQTGARFVSFETLLAESDFVSIHTPLNDQTRHLFTAETFAQMKPTACLINTARGPVVKEADLATALANGQIRGAALDVFEDEPRLQPALVTVHDRLVVAPHIGSATIETRQKMARMAVANVLGVLQGEGPKTAVNPQVWTTE